MSAAQGVRAIGADLNQPIVGTMLYDSDHRRPIGIQPCRVICHTGDNARGAVSEHVGPEIPADRLTVPRGGAKKALTRMWSGTVP